MDAASAGALKRANASNEALRRRQVSLGAAHAYVA